MVIESQSSQPSFERLKLCSILVTSLDVIVAPFLTKQLQLTPNAGESDSTSQLLQVEFKIGKAEPGESEQAAATIEYSNTVTPSFNLSSRWI